MNKRPNYLIDPLAIEETVQTPADVVNGISLYKATSSVLVFRSTCNVSQTFFFGFRTSSGSPLNPGNVTLSPTVADLGGSTNSTWIFFIKNLISVHVWWSRLKQAMTKPAIFFKVKLIQNQPWALMGIMKPFSETS